LGFLVLWNEPSYLVV